MKKILQFLIRFKWAFLFPFAAFFIWFVGFLASSLERMLPYILNAVLSFWHFNGASNINQHNIDTLVNNIQWFVNGINAWFPLYIFVVYVFLIISWRLTFMAIRFFIKLITVGQV